MFDELDDPAYAGPRPGARDAVAMRAGQLRRHRRAGAAAVVASFVLVLALGSAGLRSLRADSLKQVVPVAPVTPTAQPAPTPTPSPDATPTPTPTPVPTRSAAPTASPEPTPPPFTRAHAQPTRAPVRQPVEDVVGRWVATRQVDSCAPADALPPRAGRLEEAGVSMTLDIPATIDGRDPAAARLVFTNNTSETIMFYYTGVEAGPVQTTMSGAGGFSGEGYRQLIDRESGTRLEMRAGETKTVPVTVVTDTCAPRRTFAAPGRPVLLDPGTYQVSVGIMITEIWDWAPPADESPPPEGERRQVFSTVPLTVTVT